MNSTIIVVISGLLTAFFVFASSIKILGWQKMIFETQLKFFKKYGFNRMIMAMVGFVEMLAQPNEPEASPAQAITTLTPSALGPTPDIHDNPAERDTGLVHFH
ncbi:MAG: DoxX family protein [Halioglobus sp.]